MSVQPQSEWRAEGRGNEPTEPRAILLFMNALCRPSDWAVWKASVLSLEGGMGLLAKLCSLYPHRVLTQ